MASLASIDRQKIATVFRSFERSHVRDALSAIVGRLRRLLNGEETLPDVVLLAALLARAQIAAMRRLIAADKAHEEELIHDQEPRQRRDEVGERLYKKLVEVRRIIAGFVGPEHSAKVLGLPGQTATVTEGERLWRQAMDTVNRLADPEFTLPGATTDSFVFDPPTLASELRGVTVEFRQALDAVALERRRAEKTLAIRDARLAEAKQIEAACRRFYEGFFLLAGRADLSDRFRRALRRAARTASSTASSEPEPGTGQSDEPSQDGESSDGEPTDGEPVPAAPPRAAEPRSAAPQPAALPAIPAS